MEYCFSSIACLLKKKGGLLKNRLFSNSVSKLEIIPDYCLHIPFWIRGIEFFKSCLIKGGVGHICK